jgi:L-lysine 2,3-aminomutase
LAKVRILPTSICAAHCQYCFRQDVLSEEHESKDKALDIKLNNLKEHVKNNPNIKEIILSGGDPMTLPFSSLKKIIFVIKEELNIESLEYIQKPLATHHRPLRVRISSNYLVMLMSDLSFT